MPTIHETPRKSEQGETAEHLPRIEATLGGLHIHIWHPQGLRTNDEIASWGLKTVTGKDMTAEMIKEKTGVRVRSIAKDDETVQTMAERAVEPLISEIGNRLISLQFLTSFPNEEERIPGLNHAGSLAAQYGMENLLPNLAGKNGADNRPTLEANDHHFACSSGSEVFTHIGNTGRFLGDSWVGIVGSEKYSDKLADPTKGETDPAYSYTMFGDASGCMVFRHGKDLTVLASEPIDFGEDTRNIVRMPIRTDAICEPAFSTPIGSPLLSDIQRANGEIGKFSMEGGALIRKMRRLGKDIDIFLKKAGIDPKDIALINPHQASDPVLNHIQASLTLTLQDKMFRNVETGNYSGISQMRALAQAINEGRVKSGDMILFVGFGAGLFASLQLIKLGEK